MTDPDSLAPTNDTGDQFLRLFVQAEPDLLRAIMALVPNAVDARDVLQETAAALWAKRAEYDPSRPFIAWSCGFALNQARMFLRSEARQRARLGVVAENLLAARREELSETLDTRRDYLRDCLNALPVAQRDLVRGYYLEERTVDDLASQTGRTVDAVYKAIQRARAALLACVERRTGTNGGL